MPHTIALLETMPDHLRESHRAARNWGSYPANGATREWTTLEEAIARVAEDSDDYAHIVRSHEIDVGDSVIAERDVEEDADTGKVLSIDAGVLTIAWSGLTQTQIPFGEVERIRVQAGGVRTIYV